MAVVLLPVRRAQLGLTALQPAAGLSSRWQTATQHLTHLRKCAVASADGTMHKSSWPEAPSNQTQPERHQQMVDACLCATQPAQQLLLLMRAVWQARLRV